MTRPTTGRVSRLERPCKAELNGWRRKGGYWFSIVLGTREEWVASKRDLVTHDAKRQYEKFHRGTLMAEDAMAGGNTRIFAMRWTAGMRRPGPSPKRRPLNSTLYDLEA